MQVLACTRRAIFALQIVLGGLAFSQACVAQAAPAPIAPAVDAERLALAKEMNKVIGVEANLEKMLPSIMKGFEDGFVQAHPTREKEIREAFRRLTIKFQARLGELVDRIAAVYAEKFTLAELQELVAYLKLPAEKRDVAAFRQSALGLKFVQLMPDLRRQATEAGEAWGERLGLEVDQEMQKELHMSVGPL